MLGTWTFPPEVTHITHLCLNFFAYRWNSDHLPSDALQYILQCVPGLISLRIQGLASVYREELEQPELELPNLTYLAISYSTAAYPLFWTACSNITTLELWGGNAKDYWHHRLRGRGWCFDDPSSDPSAELDGKPTLETFEAADTS
jgi:hypothetical protein